MNLKKKWEERAKHEGKNQQQKIKNTLAQMWENEIFFLPLLHGPTKEEQHSPHPKD